MAEDQGMELQEKKGATLSVPSHAYSKAPSTASAGSNRSDDSGDGSKSISHNVEAIAAKRADEILAAEETIIDPSLSKYLHAASTMTNALVSIIRSTRIGAFGDKTDLSSESKRGETVSPLMFQYQYGKELKTEEEKKAKGKTIQLHLYISSFRAFWKFWPALFNLCFIYPLSNMDNKWSESRGAFLWEFFVTGLIGLVRFLFGALIEGPIRMLSVFFKWFARVDHAVGVPSRLLSGAKNYLYNSKYDVVRYIVAFKEWCLDGGMLRKVIGLFLFYTVIRIPIKLLTFLLMGASKLIFDKVAFFFMHVTRILTSFMEMFRFTGNGAHPLRMFDSFLKIVPELIVLGVMTAMIVLGAPLVTLLATVAFSAMLTGVSLILIGRISRPFISEGENKREKLGKLSMAINDLFASKKAKVIGIAVVLFMVAALVAAFVLTGGLGFPAAIAAAAAAFSGSTSAGALAAWLIMGFTSFCFCWPALDYSVSTGKTLKPFVKDKYSEVLSYKEQRAAEKKKAEQEGGKVAGLLRKSTSSPSKRDDHEDLEQAALSRKEKLVMANAADGDKEPVEMNVIESKNVQAGANTFSQVQASLVKKSSFDDVEFSNVALPDGVASLNSSSVSSTGKAAVGFYQEADRERRASEPSVLPVVTGDIQQAEPKSDGNKDDDIVWREPVSQAGSLNA